VLEVGGNVESGVELRRRGAELDDDAAAGVDSGTGAESGRVYSYAGEADALRTGRDGGANIAEGAAALCTAEDLGRQVRAVALDRNVDVVFKREGDDVLGGEIEVCPRALMIRDAGSS